MDNCVMPAVSACSMSNGLALTPKFALVSYINQPLAGFLDQLRLDLDPSCKPRAHVTLLPPRLLCNSQDKAAREIRNLVAQFQPFEIRLGEVARFPTSNVVHITLGSGRERLLQMHRIMNCGANQYKEGFEYCPHVTVGQNLDPAVADDVFRRAREAWDAYPFSRTFPVDRLAFVRSMDCTNWVDLEEFPLMIAPTRPAATRIDLPEPSPV